MISAVAFSAIRISTPLIYAALGGLLTYQAGILNIALDGFMIVAAFAAIAVAYATESLTLGVCAGVASSVVLAALLALFNLRLKANIFIAGIAVTFMAYGLTALLLKGVLGQEGVFSSDRIPTFPPLHIPIVADIPVVGRLVSGHTLLVYLAYLLVPVVAFFLYHTRWGLRGRRRRQRRPAQVSDHALVGPILWSRRVLSVVRLCVAVRETDDQRTRSHRARRDLFR
jgi:simple sugar transport system permease protein